MFSSSFRASLVALVASAAAVCAAPAGSIDLLGLYITLSLEVEVDGLVTITVANDCDKELKLLKDPRGVLDDFPEDTFTITGADGSHPSFTGAKAKYSPSYAAGLKDTNVYTVLAPGARIEVTHDLTTAYDLSGSNGGEFSVEPSNLFTYVDADGTTKDIYATVGNIPKVKLAGNLPARTHDKRATFAGCSATQQTQINTAVGSAQTYATNAYSYIQGISTGTTRYTTWFGTYDSSRKTTVQDHFRLISGNTFSSFTYDCSCTKAGVFAYVYPDQFGSIYLCPAFWNAPVTGTDSRAGTIVHEASHFTKNGGTKDYAYGQTNCKNLATSNPAQAIFNADSHEYFTENTPAL